MDITRKRLKRFRIAPWLVAAGLAIATVGHAEGAGAAVPNCGGQGAAPQPVPYTCNLPGQEIAGSSVSGVVNADGNALTVTYLLAAPRADDVPIRVVYHVGNSGFGGPQSEASGVIPAGATTATLVVVAPCQLGQVDIKFFFTGNGQAEGRVGGPTIENGTGCTSDTTTTTTTTTTPIVTTTNATSGSTSPSSVIPGSLGTLPATGNDSRRPLGAAAVVLALGVVAWYAARRRAVD
jgi:hypothetical protein